MTKPNMETRAGDWRSDLYIRWVNIKDIIAYPQVFLLLCVQYGKYVFCYLFHVIALTWSIYVVGLKYFDQACIQIVKS